MNYKYLIYLYSFSFLLLISGCSKYQKLLKSSDNDKKYEQAEKYYQKGDYLRAVQLFDQLIPMFRGTEKAEKVNYYYAYCHYHQEDYILASYYFNRFAKSFPKSEYTEECYFMSAYCKYLDSPQYSLDQTNTYEAIKELQLFINLYPQSSRVQECNKLIDELRMKLERKDYEIAMLYYKMEDYKACLVSFKNLLRDYPDSPHREEILFYTIRANYQYAVNSIPSKQTERYLSAIESYNKFISYYPGSRYADEAGKMNAISKEKISTNQ